VDDLMPVGSDSTHKSHGGLKFINHNCKLNYMQER
jgi:hypothetical protein